MKINKLSVEERHQLGTQATKTFRYPTAVEWRHIRSVLLKRSMKAANRQGFPLDRNMVAYTPGETLGLLKQPEVVRWHKAVARARLPKWVDVVVFVPCAKSKPWEGCQASTLYRAYNAVRRLMKDDPDLGVYFITISEPLGIVLEEYWGEFPNYDNPGLFTQSVERTGRVFTRDWEKVFGMPKKILPFGKRAYKQAINHLGKVIAQFVANNPKPIYLCFVEEKTRLTSHRRMLEAASQVLGREICTKRYHKRPRSRAKSEEIQAHIMSKLER